MHCIWASKTPLSHSPWLTWWSQRLSAGSSAPPPIFWKQNDSSVTLSVSETDRRVTESDRDRRRIDPEAPRRAAFPGQSSRSGGRQNCTKGNISPETRTVLSQGVQDGIRDVGTTRHTQRLQAVAAPADRDESLVCDLLLVPPQQKRGSRVSTATFAPSTPFGDFLRSNCCAAIVSLVVTGTPARWRRLLRPP